MFSKQILLLLSLLLSFSQFIFSQNTISEKDFEGIYFSFETEFPFIKNDSFNGLLTNNALPKAEHALASPGVSFRSHQNDVIIYVTYNKATKLTEYDFFITKLKYSSIAVGFGYDLSKSLKYSFYPYLGIKNFKYGYQYNSKVEENTSLEEYLNLNNKYLQIENNLFNADLGIGLSWQPWWLSVGCKAGFLVPMKKKWFINDKQHTLENKDYSIKTNLYFSLSIGIGINSEVEKFNKKRSAEIEENLKNRNP